MSQKPTKTISEELNGWGVSLLIMAGIQLFIPLLDSLWGAVLAGLGVMCLAIKKPGMIIVIGIGIMFAGISNIVQGFSGHITFLCVFGIMQISWAIKEFKKYSVYQDAALPAEDEKQEPETRELRQIRGSVPMG